MKIIYTDNSFVEADDEKPCVECGKLTNKIEVHFECRVCSDECCLKLVNRCMKDTRNIEL